MGDVERLVTVVDLDDRGNPGHSVRARHEAVLADGRRVVLLDDRGWSSSAPVTRHTSEEVESTAKMVVGPDGPAPGQTSEEAEAGHWAFLEQKLRESGVAVEAGELRGLSHDVEISERLREGLAQSPTADAPRPPVS